VSGRSRAGAAFTGAFALFLASSARAEAPAPAPAGVRTVSFEQAVREALSKNPNVQVAAIEIDRAEALERQARATSFPTLTGNGVYTRLDDDRTFSGRVVQARDSVSANVTLTVPLIVPQQWAKWTRASDNVDVARFSAADLRRQVALAAGRAWLTVLVQKREVQVAVQARDASKAHFDYAHTRFVGGVGNRLDEVRANQELATNEATVHTQLAALVKARAALGVLLAVDEPIDVPDQEPAGAAAGGVAAVPSLATALDETKARADVRAGDERVRAAERSRNRDWADYSPYLVGVAQPFYQNPPSLVTPLTGWQAQLVLTIPLYDGGLRYGQEDERRALLGEARVGRDAALRQARSDVRAGFEAMQRADDALVAARDAARLAHESLDLATIAYRAGATTNIEVIDAERRARDADAAVALAEDAARQARLDLLAASGRFP